MSVIYHTDRAAMAAVEGLIDMGIDVLQALQFSVDGMDPRALKRRFGDRLCFEGGVSVQTTLPFGPVDGGPCAARGREADQRVERGRWLHPGLIARDLGRDAAPLGNTADQFLAGRGLQLRCEANRIAALP